LNAEDYKYDYCRRDENTPEYIEGDFSLVISKAFAHFKSLPCWMCQGAVPCLKLKYHIKEKTPAVYSWCFFFLGITQQNFTTPLEPLDRENLILLLQRVHELRQALHR
jgi:hypothetical protein